MPDPFDKKERADRQAILNALRSRIVSGEMPPGSLIPKRTELEKRFGASPLTIQRAVDHLRREGFIHVRPRLGTFVTEYPPHLFHHALIFATAPRADGSWSRFYRALSDQATAMSHKPPRRIENFYGVEAHDDNENYRTLVTMTRAHRFAGIIFASPADLYAQSPLITEPGIPRVAFSAHLIDGVSTVELDQSSFVHQAFDYLAARGRRKLAVLANPRGRAFAEQIRTLAGRHGMTLHPYWFQQVHLDAAEAAANAVHLLMHAGQAERPDALLIADDNLVEYASAGLLSAGISVPRELEVVAHCNFPWPAPSVLSFMRLGFDIVTVLERCMQAIAHQRETGKTSRHVISARFDS